MKYEVNFCLKTLYNYIEKGIFYKLNRRHLPYKKKYSRDYVRDKRIRKTGGLSIEKRSEAINNREELGHWEMDTVVGKRGMGSLPPRLNGESEQKRVDNEARGQELKVCCRGCKRA